MAKKKLKWFVLIAMVPGLLLLFVAGLWTFMIVTATPLHPTPEGVPSSSRAAPSATWAGAVAEARQLVRADITGHNLPGVSVAVGVGGEIVWAEGFGFADLETKEPVEPGMRFRIGSVSIPLTSIAAGLLMEQGRLKLDDEIQTYVPSFPKKPWPITLRQLMAHTSGIKKDSGDEEPLSTRCDRTVDAVTRFKNNALLFQPGTQFRYSTYGWVLVSVAVEAAAGEPFFTYMRKQILDPLGMTDTVQDLSDEPLPNQVSFYYPRFAAEPRYGPDPAGSGDYSCLAGAQGFLSTPSDVVRFGIAMQSGKLLQPDTLKLLQTEQRLPSGEGTGYTLGWDLETTTLAGESTRQIGHDGEYFIGGSSSFVIFPDRGIIVAMSANISFAKMEPIAVRIAQTFAGTR